MRLDLKLSSLPRPLLSGALLNRPIAELIKIRTRNEERWGTGRGSPVFENRKANLRKRFQDAVSPRTEFLKIKAKEVGWQRLVLSLYIESNGQSWLPVFDDEIASDILGSDGRAWSVSRRRQAVRLFFTQFASLPAVAFLAEGLRAGFADYLGRTNSTEAVWTQARDIVFQVDGPERIISGAKKGESLLSVMERYAIPSKGAFAERIRLLYLLTALHHCSLGEEPEVLNQIEQSRDAMVEHALPMGAAALRIMIRRVETEGRGVWPEGWGKWLLRLGCDPRMGRHTAEAAKWWGWATDSEWKIAVQGVIGLSLKFFFDFLDGTVSVHQWEERREFLETCFDAGKIVDARLALNAHFMKRLPLKMRDKLSTATLTSTTEDTCIIALRCTDDVYLMEGTHSYGLRAFHRHFPIAGFWERSRQHYADRELRISPIDCPAFIPHQGRWVKRFLDALRTQFHVEWTDFEQWQ